MRRWILPAVLVFEIVVFNLIGGPEFNSVAGTLAYFKSYFMDILAQSAPVLLLAGGMTLVLMTAGIDLSVAGTAPGLAARA